MGPWNKGRVGGKDKYLPEKALQQNGKVTHGGLLQRMKEKKRSPWERGQLSPAAQLTEAMKCEKRYFLPYKSNVG